MGPPGNCPHEPIPGVPGPGTACGGAVGYNGCTPCPMATHGNMAISRMPKRVRVLFIAKSPGESDGEPTINPCLRKGLRRLAAEIISAEEGYIIKYQLCQLNESIT